MKSYELNKYGQREVLYDLKLHEFSEGYHLWHGTWLELAELNEQRAIEELQVGCTGELKQLRKHRLRQKQTYEYV